MAQPRADYHQSRVPIRECPHHASPTADLSVQPFDHIVCADARPVLAWEVAVGQRFFDAIITDRRGRDLTAPQGFSDVLHAVHGYTCQIHFDECFFHAALTAAIPLDDGGFKGHALESWHMERNVAECCSEVTVIVTAAVALTSLITLVASSLRQ